MHTADQWARVFLIDDEKVKLLKSSFPFGELYIYREQVARLYPEVSNRVSDRLGAGILWLGSLQDEKDSLPGAQDNVSKLAREKRDCR
jgi:hypothetical protein